MTNAASAATLEVKLPNACNATGCLMRQGSLVVSRITPQGVPLDPPTIAPVLAAPGERSPFVVSGAGEYLVVWREEGESASTIRAGRVSANGASLDPAPLTISGPMSLNMTGALNAVSFNGTDFLVLYADTGGLRVKRVSPLGVVKDPIGIVIAEYPTFGVLACGSDNCLVAWGAAAGVVATRLAADGSRLDSPPIQIVDDGWPTMLAARGSGYVLQFDNGIDGGTVLLDATGHKSGPVKARKAQREYPCGSNFLVFKQPPVTPGSPGSFVVSLVDVAGSVLVDNVNVGWRMSSEYGVASKATGCAVAALKQTDDSNDIYANFIQNDGSVGLPQAMPIATDAFTEVSPALAFDGDRLLVAYSHLIPTAPYGNFRIAARLVSQGEINPGTGGAAGGLAGTGGVVGTGGSVVGTGGSGDAAGSGDLAAGVAGISTSDGGAAGDAEEVGVGGIINTGGGGRSATGGSAVGGAPRDKGGKRGGGCAVTSRNPAGPADHYADALLLVALAGWRRASRARLTERAK